MQNSWSVYIIQCADNTLYTGISNNIDKRIATHNSGKGAKYTRGRTPVKLVYQEKLTNKAVASQREAEIKKLTRQEKLNLIDSFV